MATPDPTEGASGLTAKRHSLLSPTNLGAVAGFALLMVSIVAPNAWPLRVGMAALGVTMVVTAVWNPAWLAPLISRFEGAAWWTPRLILMAIATAIIASSLQAATLPQCPAAYDGAYGGALVHTRLRDNVLVCTYHYLGGGL